MLACEPLEDRDCLILLCLSSSWYRVDMQQILGKEGQRRKGVRKGGKCDFLSKDPLNVFPSTQRLSTALAVSCLDGPVTPQGAEDQASLRKTTPAVP